MRSLQSILFATDFLPATPDVEKIATHLATVFDSHVTLLHVIDPKVTDPEGMHHRREASAARLREVSEQLALYNVVIDESAIAVGPPADTIVHKAREIDADLILIGAGEASRFDRPVGPIADLVLQRAGQPVLAVRPGSPEARFHRILCPVDLSPVSRHALENAIRLTRALHGELLVQTVVPLARWITPSLQTGKVATAIGRHERQWREEFDRFLEKVDFGSISWQKEVDVGVPHQAIASAARAFQTNVIVMGSTGRSALARVLMGSVSRRMLQQLPCSLLLIKRIDVVDELSQGDAQMIGLLVGEGYEMLAAHCPAQAAAKFRQARARIRFTGLPWKGWPRPTPNWVIPQRRHAIAAARMLCSPSQRDNAAGRVTIMLVMPTILFTTDLQDSSAQAFAIACSLARDHGARLIVLHVAARPPFVTEGEMEKAWDQPDGYEKELEARLHELRPADPRIEVEYRLPEGEVIAEVVHAAEETDCDLIVMATHGRTGLARALLGSVAEEVLRLAPCPVLTVRTVAAAEEAGKGSSPHAESNGGMHRPAHTILYPTDFSERAAEAFPLACSLARDHGARLLILHVYPPPLDHSEVVARRQGIGYHEELWKRLHEIQSSDPKVCLEYLLAEGEPEQKILDAAAQTNCDLIVMGTHGRTGLRRVILGSVAEQIVRHASCPVLTVKYPFGESEPVTLESAHPFRRMGVTP
jgi:nucleotide-binding universal stress UspA family protein